MNIIHFSNGDSGGAGIAGYRLHKGLISNEINSVFFVKNKTLNDKSVIQIDGKNRFLFHQINRIETKLNIFDKRYYFFDKGRNTVTDVEFIEQELTFKPDVIILHWISGFVDLKVIYELYKKYNCKVFWMPLDMAPMTGGCHYAWECNQYKEDCSNCPALIWPYNNVAKQNLQYKKQFLKKMNIEIISAAGWLKYQLKSSILFKKNKIHEILLGIDENIFRPLSSKEIKLIKNSYRIPTNKKLIFFGASRIEEERKGLLYLIKALEVLSKDLSFNKSDVLLLTAGNLNNSDLFKNIDMKHLHIGHLNSDDELAKAYQISDLFISSSIEDSGPMMINESIMCGTPVVSFKMGVAVDLIVNNETGYLAELKNINDLAYGIKTIFNLNKDKYDIIAQNCRSIGLKKTSKSQQIEKFLSIIKN